MIETISSRKCGVNMLERMKDLGGKKISKEKSIDYVEGICYRFVVDYGQVWRQLIEIIQTAKVGELDDSELQTLALRSGSYKFWDDPCEDIYTLEDGESV